jgi:hypothetical protein
MHKHDPRPPRHTSDLGHQAPDDPLDSTTMPHAARSAAPDKGRVMPKLHGRTHEPMGADRRTAEPGHGRSHLPAKEKKGGSRAWVGPERQGEREAIDELGDAGGGLGPLEEEEEEEEGGGGGGGGASGMRAGEEGEEDKTLTLDEYEARLGRPV